METGGKNSDGVVSSQPILRFDSGGGVRSTMDECVREYPLLVRLNEVPIVRIILSPYQFEEFVVGFLVNEGFIDGPSDIRSIEISGGTASVTCSAVVPLPGKGTVLIESTGAKRFGYRTNKSRLLNTLPADPLVSSGVIFHCMKYLDEMPIHRRTGGTHCAVLFTAAGEKVVACEDIGRHNAVDKTVGGALQAGADLKNLWLAVAGRLAADMVRKPVASGIPLIASLTAATLEGIELGRRNGLTVIGHCKKGSFNCYCHPERISDYNPAA